MVVGRYESIFWVREYKSIVMATVTKSTPKPSLNHFKSVYLRMKATEIRIGNLVKYMGREQAVTSEIIRECELNNATTWPIPLTEEKLLELGFKKMNWGIITYYHSMFELRSDFTLKGVDYNIEVKTVHRLQNLFYSLTGEELTPQAITSSK